MAKPKGKHNTDNPTPPAEQSNKRHPTAPGERRTIPGGGIVDRDTADAPGITSKQEVESPENRAFGARRAGTTRSGPAAMPSGSGPGGTAGPLDNEAITGGDSDAPLSAPTGGTGAPKPGRASRAPEADAASAGPRSEGGQEREKRARGEQ